jgi:hypothetical protein
MSDVKGMIQFGGATYRIEKTARGKYDVIRILDEVCIGSFETLPKLHVQPKGVAEKLLNDIALTALKQAKISWQRMPAPRPKSAPPEKAPSSRRSTGRSSPSVRMPLAKPT